MENRKTCDKGRGNSKTSCNNLSINNKKGIFFILDIVIGFIILLVGISLLITFYYQIPESNQFTLYTSDATFFFSSTQVDEVKNSVIRSMINSSTLYEDEYIGEAFARFCNSNDTISYERIIASTLTNIVPLQFNYQASILYLNQTPCLQVHTGDLSTFNTSSLFSSSRVIVFGSNESFDPVGPYIFEVSVW